MGFVPFFEQATNPDPFFYSLQGPSMRDLRDDLAGVDPGVVLDAVVADAVEVGEEPVQGGAAEEPVALGVVVHRRAIEEKAGVVGPVGSGGPDRTVLQVGYALQIGFVGAAPLGGEGDQGWQVGVEGGGARDDDVLTAPSEERVAAEAADEDVVG